MMDPTDIQLLIEMQQAIRALRCGEVNVGDLADQLLAVRDRLQFRDREWELQFTQHIATLDSASTFVPENDEQASQGHAAMTTATDGLLNLIEAKLV